MAEKMDEYGVAAEQHRSDSEHESNEDREKQIHPVDTAHSPPVAWTITRIIAFVALCMVYVGAQGILYFTGGTLSYIQASIGTNEPNWLLTANTLAVTAIIPFVGYITDLLGRRWVCIFGSLLLVISCAVLGNIHTLYAGIIAEVLGGFGAGICELTALAGVAEITPVKWRGVSLAIVTFSIIPFIPYFIYIVEFEKAAPINGWRWSYLLVGLWNLIGLVGVLFCYKPPPRHNVDGLSKLEITKRVDWIGGVLSISGATLFIAGLQIGGYTKPWTTADTLVPLILGFLIIAVAFPVYEKYYAKYPMVPGEIFRGQNVVTVAYVIVFIAGMLFYSVLGFFPLMIQKLWNNTLIIQGCIGLSYPLGILFGACFVNTLMSYTNGHVRELFFISATIMTAFTAALAVSTPNTQSVSVAMATLASIGIGALIVPALSLALYACPDRYIGTTAALSLAVRFLGGSVGTAIYYNIFTTKFATAFPEMVAAAVSPPNGNLPASSIPLLLQALSLPVNAAAAAMQVPGITIEELEAAAEAAQLALTTSLTNVWYSTIPFGVIAMVACLFIPNIKKYMSGRVAVDIH